MTDRAADTTSNTAAVRPLIDPAPGTPGPADGRVGAVPARRSVSHARATAPAIASATRTTPITTTDHRVGPGGTAEGAAGAGGDWGASSSTGGATRTPYHDQYRWRRRLNWRSSIGISPSPTAGGAERVPQPHPHLAPRSGALRSVESCRRGSLWSAVV